MSCLKHPVARWLAVLVASLLVGASGSPLRAATTVTICTQAELESKIFQARTNGGDGVVTFDCDGTIVLTNTVTLRFSAPSTNGLTNIIVLDATGHSITISGQTGTNLTSQPRLFELERGVVLAIANLNFINGQSTNGAAFLISSNSALLAVGCVFSNNIVNGSNGLAGASARTSTVNGNASDGHSGTAAASAAGGAIFNYGYAWLSQCSFLTNGVIAGNGGSGGSGGNGTVSGGDGGHGGRGGAAMGGAIYNQGRLVTTNCVFYSNFVLGGFGGEGALAGTGLFPGLDGRGAAGGAAAGGAIFNHPKSSATNINTTFALNVTDSGDSADGGSSRGRGKTGAGGPHSSGGAIANFGTNVLLNCTFFSNGANAGNGGSGSAGSTSGGRGGNGGSAWGGNLFNGKKAILIATHCTISDGGAVQGTNGVAGGGIFAGRDGDRGLSRGANIANSNGTFTLRNSIIAYPANGTNGYSAGKTFTFEGRNISSDRSFKVTGIPRASVTLVLTNLDPKLGTLGANGGPVDTIPLLDASPAINMATNGFGLLTDARGIGRPLGTNFDLGSYEYGIFLTAPTILAQPVNALVFVSNSVTFAVTAQGDPPLRYQWRRNGTVITNATGATFVLTNAQISSAGSYDVLVSNNSGSVESADASLTVVTPATITRQPTNVSVSLGATATFQVTAIGDSPVTYRWTSNGVPILGATLSTYTLTNVHPSLEAVYRVIVTNPYRSVTSSNATLTVSSIAPTILTSPTNASVISGQTAILTAEAGGTAPLQYLWYFNQTNLLGEFQSYGGPVSLVLSDAQTEREGTYRVVVTNYAGRATSAVATLTVRILAPIITLQPESLTAAPEDEAVFSVGVVGSTPMTFQWYFNVTNLLDGATNSTHSISSVTTNDAGDYHVVIVNTGGTTNSLAASLVVADAPPTILVQPAHTAVLAGGDATFSVVARGTRPFGYQWYLDGEAITNATNATLIITDVVFEDTESSYSVEVTNLLGLELSDDATITLLEPFDLDCDSPNCTSTVLNSDSNFQYTLQMRQTVNDAWTGVATQAGEDGPLEFIHTPQPFNDDPVFYRVVVTSFVPEGDPVIFGDPTDVVIAQGQDAEFTVSAASSEILSYRWYFNDSINDTLLLIGETRPLLVVTNAQPTNAGTYFAVVHGLFGVSTSAPATLAIQTDPVSIITDPVNTTVYGTEQAIFSVITAGSEPKSYQWYFNGVTEIPGATDATLDIPNAQPGDVGSYHVVISNYFGAMTSASATLTVLDPTPAITGQPVSLSIFSGEDATLSVTNSGLAPFTYQWYLDETNLLAGATGSSFTVTNAQTFSSGAYRVIVSNASGSVTSAVAIASITDAAPTITVSPEELLEVNIGESFQLSVTAIGSRPFTYQWVHYTLTNVNDVTFVVGTNLVPNATNSTLVVPSIETEEALSTEGFYEVWVTNLFGVSVSAQGLVLINGIGVP